MRWFWLIVLVVVPAAELYGIALMGEWIGGWRTFALIVLTGLLGAWLLRKETLRALHQAREQIRSGVPPGIPIVNGLCVLAGGLLLMMPGFISDLAGLLLILPPTRAAFRSWLVNRLRRWAEQGRVNIFFRRY
jgi:UPF0716 protein FxsA